MPIHCQSQLPEQPVEDNEPEELLELGLLELGALELGLLELGTLELEL